MLIVRMCSNVKPERYKKEVMEKISKLLNEEDLENMEKEAKEFRANFIIRGD